MKKSVLFLITLYGLRTFAGVGGIIGGGETSSWAPRGTWGKDVLWPKIKLNDQKSYPVHKLCIASEEHLRVLGRKNILLDRVYDQYGNCWKSSDKYCSLAGRYVEPEIKVYKVRDDNLERFSDYNWRNLNDQPIRKSYSLTIPHCRK